MILSSKRIPYLLLVLLQICCISNMFVLAVVPSKTPGKAPAAKAPPQAKGKPGDKSTPGGSGRWPLQPVSPIGGGGGRPQPVPRPSPPRPGPAAPLPQWRVGNVIGARAKYYEANSKVTTMHPGIIVAGPDPNGNFRVAMISNKLLGNGPRQQASKYLGAIGIDGEISLGMPTVIHGQYLRPWRRPGQGDTPPLSSAKLAELKRDINTATKYAGLRRRSLDPRLVRRMLARRAVRGT